MCREATAFRSPCPNPIGTGCKSGTSLAPVPWEVPACSPGSSAASGSFAFVALSEIIIMKAPGTELLEQHSGNDCK